MLDGQRDTAFQYYALLCCYATKLLSDHSCFTQNMLHTVLHVRDT